MIVFSSPFSSASVSVSSSLSAVIVVAVGVVVVSPASALPLLSWSSTAESSPGTGGCLLGPEWGRGWANPVAAQFSGILADDIEVCCRVLGIERKSSHTMNPSQKSQTKAMSRFPGPSR